MRRHPWVLRYLRAGSALLLALLVTGVSVTTGAPPEADGKKSATPILGVLEAYPNGDLGHTILFGRFPTVAPGAVNVLIRDSAGTTRRHLAGEFDAGSILVVWDGVLDDGTVAPAGAYAATFESVLEGVEARFELP